MGAIRSFSIEAFGDSVTRLLWGSALQPERVWSLNEKKHTPIRVGCDCGRCICREPSASQNPCSGLPVKAPLTSSTLLWISWSERVRAWLSAVSRPLESLTLVEDFNGRCLGRGRADRICPNTDPSRNLLQGFLLADQTPSVRLVQPGGHACLGPGPPQEWIGLNLNCCSAWRSSRWNIGSRTSFRLLRDWVHRNHCRPPEPGNCLRYSSEIQRILARWAATTHPVVDLGYCTGRKMRRNWDDLFTVHSWHPRRRTCASDKDTERGKDCATFGSKRDQCQAEFQATARWYGRNCWQVRRSRSQWSCVHPNAVQFDSHTHVQRILRSRHECPGIVSVARDQSVWKDDSSQGVLESATTSASPLRALPKFVHRTHFLELAIAHFSSMAQVKVVSASFIHSHPPRAFSLCVLMALLNVSFPSPLSSSSASPSRCTTTVPRCIGSRCITTTAGVWSSDRFYT